MDLYGIKEKVCFDKEYVITSKPCEGYHRSYGKCLIPMEYNIIDSIPGSDLFLAKVEQVNEIDRIGIYIHKQYGNVGQLKYFYNIESLHFHTFNSEIKKLNLILSEAQKQNQVIRNQLNAVQKSFLCRLSNTMYRLKRKVKTILKKILKKLLKK